MRRSAAVILVALLAGCADPQGKAGAEDPLGNAGVSMDIDTYGAENMESAANIEAPSIEPGPDDARTVVASYFDALAGKRYAEAFGLWEPGAAGMDAQAFAATFAKYGKYNAEIGLPGRVDAGAGQRYVTVPVRVTATLADGGENVTMIGPVTLHRTGQIDGASPTQRSWRIRDTALKPRPAPSSGVIGASYVCDGGPAFAVGFDNDADTATITLPGEAPVVLAGQRPASGIWYAGEGWELRGKGDAATLTRRGVPPVECAIAATPESSGAGDGAQSDQTR